MLRVALRSTRPPDGRPSRRAASSCPIAAAGESLNCRVATWRASNSHTPAAWVADLFGAIDADVVAGVEPVPAAQARDGWLERVDVEHLSARERAAQRAAAGVRIEIGDVELGK